MPQRLFHDVLPQTACAQPDKPALIVGDQTYTYRELHDAALRCARGLQDLGLERGDRVAIYLTNSWLSAVSIFGTLIAGGVMIVVNPQTKAEKLRGLLSDSEARFLITDQEAMSQEVPPTVEHVLCSRLNLTANNLHNIETLLRDAPPEPNDPGTIPLDLAALIYTSGSTGQPKGVMMTHQSMVFTLGSVSEYLRLGADDRIFNVLPLAFSYGLYQLFMSVGLGATLILERSFSYPAQTAKRIQETHATVFPGVPTFFAALLSLQKKGLVLPSVKRVTNAAAALPESFVADLQTLFPNALIFKMYGLTECKRVCYLEPELITHKPYSVGKAIPGTEVFLLSEAGESVAPGETGILHVRGPNVMLGYWKRPDLSAHMLKEGRYPGERVLCTYDHFRTDDEGFLYFVGRSDDIIKTGGEKVSPVEIEHVLHGIPGVREAAVVGLPDAVLGQTICAYIVLEPDTKLSEREIRQFCLAHLEALMTPKRIFFLYELPKTMSGKVRKKSLLEAEASP